MNRLLVTAFLVSGALFATNGSAASIPRMDLPLKNGDSSGAVYKMGTHADGVFVFEVFSVNCSWCNANAEQVDAFSEEYQEIPRVQVLDLGMDSDASSYLRWIGSHKPNHPVIQDVGRKVFNALKRQDGIPQTYVVNCRGELVGSTVGFWGDSERKALRAHVATALKAKCTPAG